MAGWVLMQIAVMTDLVATFQNGLDHLRIVLNAPARYKEGLREAEPTVSLKDSRNSNCRSVFAHGNWIEPVVTVYGP